ncbi:extracellular solute-binding protein family 5, partial [mine drainage metagenome]
YWDAAHVRLREEIYYPIPSASAAVERYLAGDLDLVNTPAFPPSDAGWLRRTLGAQVRVAPMYGTAFLGMLLHEKPFDNRDLRLALTLSLNRRVLDDKLMQGMDAPAHSLFPPLPHFTRQSPAWAHWPMAKRLAVARRLYHAAGYSRAHPLRVKLLYMTEG